MPSNGPSAWRLNKAEQTSVNRSLSDWDDQHSQLQEETPDEFTRLREEEKKRLTREIQEVKHNRSLAKQSAKAKATPKPKARGGSAVASAVPVGPASLEDNGVNSEYFQSLKMDLQIIAEKLGCLKSELPVPIKTEDDSKGGVQDCKYWFLR